MRSKNCLLILNNLYPIIIGEEFFSLDFRSCICIFSLLPILIINFKKKFMNVIV